MVKMSVNVPISAQMRDDHAVEPCPPVKLLKSDIDNTLSRTLWYQRCSSSAHRQAPGPSNTARGRHVNHLDVVVHAQLKRLLNIPKPEDDLT